MRELENAMSFKATTLVISGGFVWLSSASAGWTLAGLIMVVGFLSIRAVTEFQRADA